MTKWKKTAHRGSAKFKSHHAPLTLSLLIVNYLLHIRPAEIWVATQLKWASVEHLRHHVFYLYRTQGSSPKTSTYISGLLALYSVQVLGIKITLSVWRHFMTSLGRVILQGADVVLESSNVMDDQAGRSQATSHKHYAIVAGEYPLIPTSMEIRFLRASMLCHAALFGIQSDGTFGPTTEMLDDQGIRRPVPKANMILNSAHHSGSNPRDDSLKEIQDFVVNGLPAIVEKIIKKQMKKIMARGERETKRKRGNR